MPKVTFDTADYEREHGKRPRGAGRWAFCPATLYGRGDYLSHVFWVNGDTFSEARKAAAAHFAATDHRDIIVCT